MNRISILTGFVFLSISCTQVPQPLIELPAHFPQPVYQYKGNPVSQAGIDLGKLLFNDPLLSADSTIACASCHHQAFAFADGGKALSAGIKNQQGRRNAPGIFNVQWHPYFMADGGVNHLEVMPLAPITDTLEMGESIRQLITKLRRSTFYPSLFKKAFGTDSIYTRNVMLALSQYMGTLVSAHSKYDDVLLGKAQFTPEETEGKKLFEQHCAACHAGVLFSDFKFRSNGLDTSFEKDRGRARVTDTKADEGKFTTPSLRNVALTAPYMHDGRFESLSRVLQHYVHEIKPSAATDSLLIKQKINLSGAQQQAVIAFLHTLTDSVFITNKKLVP
ncbi:MAG: c-type cytochrome [Bacteroidia bacterium]|nr:c-type cytochrome [Bacteroidia bacterium]